MNNAAYEVRYYGSHPNANNDDCWTGFEFSDFKQAFQQFKREKPTFRNGQPIVNAVYVQLTGNKLSCIRRLKSVSITLSDLVTEELRQAGMVLA